jgi:hypothetical protein
VSDIGCGRGVSISAFTAHKISITKTLDDEQLDGLDQFVAYMKANGMAAFKPLSEWAEWYAVYFTEIEEQEEAK